MTAGLMLHDTTRTVAATWPERYVTDGLADGLVVCLHNTPTAAEEYPQLKGISARRDGVVAAGGRFLIDACSHVDLTDVRADTYALWGLWPHGARGDFADQLTYRTHVERTFDVQRAHGAPLMIPSPPLTRPDTEEADALLDAIAFGTRLATQTGDEPPVATVAGTAPFWSAGQDLDRFFDRASRHPVGGWHLVPIQTALTWPVVPHPAELTGMLRTTSTLALDYNFVFWANTDLMGLPLIAAGATHVGTGWDRKQRCLDPDSHKPLEGEGGTWLGMVTLDRALVAVAEAAATQLTVQRPRVAAQTLPPNGQVPAAGGARVRHHIEVLARAVADLHAHAAGEARSRHLLDTVYGRARRLIDWVEESTTADQLAAAWISPLERAIDQWRSDEGWPA